MYSLKEIQLKVIVPPLRDSLLPVMEQTKNKYIVMTNKEGSTKIVSFMTPGAGFLCWGVSI